MLLQYLRVRSAPQFFIWRCPNIASQELLINEEIRDREVRLIDAGGKVAKVWKAVKVDGHDAQVMAAIKELT